MLILTRRIGQSVRIGLHYELRVHSYGPHAVSFDARLPAGTRVEYVVSDGTPKVALVGQRLTIPRNEDRVCLTLPCGTTVGLMAFGPRKHDFALRIGFRAPRSLTIDREEVAEAKAAGLPRGTGVRVALVSLLALLASGCAHGDELRGGWYLTVGRAGECRVIEHRAKSDQLDTRTTWRGAGCASPTLERDTAIVPEAVQLAPEVTP